MSTLMTMLYLSIVVSDRLSTGIAVADIDLSFIDSVRAKMPISQVTASCFLSSINNNVTKIYKKKVLLVLC